MSKKKDQKKSGGSKKHGRSKRAKDHALSLYIKGKITFDKYKKLKNFAY